MLRFFVLYAAIALPHDTQPSARLVGQRAFVLSPGKGGVEVTVDASALAHATEFRRVSVLSAGGSDEAMRLLVEACGPSRPATATPGSFCAAGEECDLLWFDLERGAVVGQQGHLVDSCLVSRERYSDRCGRDGDSYRCAFFDARDGVDVELEFSFGGAFGAHVTRREHVP